MGTTYSIIPENFENQMNLFYFQVALSREMEVDF